MEEVNIFQFFQTELLEVLLPPTHPGPIQCVDPLDRMGTMRCALLQLKPRKAREWIQNSGLTFVSEHGQLDAGKNASVGPPRTKCLSFHYSGFF